MRTCLGKFPQGACANRLRAVMFYSAGQSDLGSGGAPHGEYTGPKTTRGSEQDSSKSAPGHDVTGSGLLLTGTMAQPTGTPGALWQGSGRVAPADGAPHPGGETLRGLRTVTPESSLPLLPLRGKP